MYGVGVWWIQPLIMYRLFYLETQEIMHFSVFMPLHPSFGFPNIVQEGVSADPCDSLRSGLEL